MWSRTCTKQPDASGRGIFPRMPSKEENKVNEHAAKVIAFLEAADEGDMKTIIKLMEEGVDVNAVDVMVSASKMRVFQKL